MIAKKQIIGFDILKFLMALFIISIHIPIKNAFFSPIQNLGVPIFFILSSFFFFNKSVNNNFKTENLLYFIKRIGYLYIFWFIVNIYFIHIDKNYFGKGIAGFLYLFRDILFSYTFPGSWFLSGLVISVTFIFILKKNSIPNWIVFSISLLIYILLYNYKYLPHMFQKPFLMMKILFRPELALTFLRGVLWVTIGYLFAEKNTSIKSIISSNIISRHTIFLSLFFLSYMFSITWKESYFITQIFMVLIIVFYAYGLKLPSNNKYLILRKASILFYFLQFPILKFLKIFDFQIYPNIICKYLFVILLCCFFSLILLSLQKHKMFAWLKYSY